MDALDDVYDGGMMKVRRRNEQGMTKVRRRYDEFLRALYGGMTKVYRRYDEDMTSL